MKFFALILITCITVSIPDVYAQNNIPVNGDVIENTITDDERHTYQVVLESGQYAHIIVEQISIDVVVWVQEPGGKKIADIDETASGEAEEVKITANLSGTYQIEIFPYINPYQEGVDTISKNGIYKIKVEDILTAAEYQQLLEAEKEIHAGAIEWLKENAIPLNGTDPEQGFEDMQPLKEIIGNARIVALGEATHGTREFFRIKHRMLEFLVEELGFNIFAMEAVMPEGFDINEYVLTGKGDPEKALHALYFWTWDTEEVLEMIRWMRRYNADPDHIEKVKFYGFDMQSSTKPMKVLESYLSEVNSDYIDTLIYHSSLSLLRNPYTAGDFYNLSEEERRATVEVLKSIINELDNNKYAFINQTSEGDWKIARLHADILTQNINASIAGFPRALVVRDSSMAANVQWIMDHEGAGSKMVIWGHDAHVAYRQDWMGGFLKDKYGQDLVNFGFKFNQGSFQAIEVLGNGRRRLRPFHVQSLEEDSWDTTLGAIGLPYAVIDLHAIPEEGPAAEWISKPHNTRGLGATVVYSSDLEPFLEDVLPRYDALLFVNETTSARPNPGGTRPMTRVLQRPENLNFENNGAEQIPEGWIGNKYSLSNFGFIVETSPEDPQQGNYCLKISRVSGRHYGTAYGSLSQRVDASEFHGKKIKLRAAVRTELEGEGNHAYLWLTIANNGDRMTDRPITTRDWQFYEIIGEVPDEVQWIDFGMALTGVGKAWFDSFSIEIMEP